MILTINEIIYVLGGMFSLFTVYLKLNNRIIELNINATNAEKEITEIKSQMRQIKDDNIKSIKEVTEALHENSAAVRELKVVINQIKH